VISINGTQAGANGTRNSRIRGFLLAAYDAQGTSYGSWSDTLGYAQTATCGQNDVLAVPDPNLGVPAFMVSAGTVGSHTGVIGNFVKVYQILNVTWTSPPVALNLTFGGVIVSDKIYNSILPLYPTVGTQGTFPLPTVATSSTPATSATPAGTSTPATSTPKGSASGLTASFFLSGLLLAKLL